MAVYRTTGVTPEWWTPESEDEEQEPVQVFIQPLTPPQLSQIMPDVSFERDWPCGPNALVMALRWGLKDWQAVYDEHGQALQCNVKNACNVLPAALQQEIATRIIRNSMVTEDDRKNS